MLIDIKFISLRSAKLAGAPELPRSAEAVSPRRLAGATAVSGLGETVERQMVENLKITEHEGR